MIPYDFWEPVLKPYESDPGSAFALAQNFAQLRDMLAKGNGGATKVVEFLDEGIKDLFPLTDFNQACFALFQRAVSAEGITPNIDPVTIVRDLEKPDKSKPERKGRKSTRKK